MTTRYVSTVSEDDVSNAVIDKLLRGYPERLAIYTTRVMGGSGNVKRNIAAFNNAAKALPQIVLADLDSIECAPELISAWLGGREAHEHLILRVAVREVEAWLLADRSAFADFVGVAINLVPQNPERLPDPKRALIDVARHCRDRHRREAIVPFGTAPVGPDYNAEMIRYITTVWDPSVAAGECGSLRRMMDRLTRLADEPWPAR